MESLFANTAGILLFVFLFRFLREGRCKMLGLPVKVKKVLILSALMFALSSVLFASNSYALFEELTQKGSEIFMGMRDIIYVVAGFGIIGVAVGGFFGNINWKWLGAIIIGLFVIATTAAFINYVAYGKSGSQIAGITDSLK